MLAATIFGLLAVLHLAVAAKQTPPVTQCSGQRNPPVEIQSVVVTGAALGKKVSFVGTVQVKRQVGKHPVLQLSFSKPNGTALPCDSSVLPCTLNLCGGTTSQEKELNKDWNNTCPVQAGTYSARLSFRLPSGPDAEAYFGDGNVVVKFNIVDGSKVLGCASIPITVDIQ